MKFIEDNWSLGRIGGHSTDVKAGSILNMFNFASPPRTGSLVLDPTTGLVVSNTLSPAVLPHRHRAIHCHVNINIYLDGLGPHYGDLDLALHRDDNCDCGQHESSNLDGHGNRNNHSDYHYDEHQHVDHHTEQQLVDLNLAFAAMGALLVVGVGVGLVAGRRRPSA